MCVLAGSIVFLVIILGRRNVDFRSFSAQLRQVSLGWAARREPSIARYSWRRRQAGFGQAVIDKCTSRMWRSWDFLSLRAACVFIDNSCVRLRSVLAPGNAVRIHRSLV